MEMSYDLIQMCKKKEVEEERREGEGKEGGREGEGEGGTQTCLS